MMDWSRLGSYRKSIHHEQIINLTGLANPLDLWPFALPIFYLFIPLNFTQHHIFVYLSTPYTRKHAPKVVGTFTSQEEVEITAKINYFRNNYYFPENVKNWDFDNYCIVLYCIVFYWDRLVGLGVSISDYWSWGRGFDPGTSTNFKCGLGLERDPPSLVRTIG